MSPNSIPSLSDHEPESDNKNYVENLLESARPFLRGQFEHVDERLPALIAAIRENGAGECWHKDNIFIDHLVHIYRILKLWKLQESVCLWGLFHNAYPIFDGFLTIFEPTISRETVRDLIGESAEKMIFLYCGIPRHKLFKEDLLSQYSDAELVEHLELFKLSLQNYIANNGKSDHEEDTWRKKIQSVVPATGLTVAHRRTGEELHVTRRVIASLLVMRIADFADQFSNFQDVLFNNLDGNMNFLGNDNRATWPGDCKPGLWMTSMSRIGALFTLIKREEELFILENENNGTNNVDDFVDRDQHLKLITPPVFENCSKILYPDDQVKARELYWEAVCFNNSGADSEKAEELLLKCIELNPFVGEPHVVLGQIYISQEKFSEGEKEAEKGLKLLLEWGTAWDKRIGWENWVSWTRVLLFKAKGKSWPTSPWDVLMLGPIKDYSR